MQYHWTDLQNPLRPVITPAAYRRLFYSKSFQTEAKIRFSCFQKIFSKAKNELMQLI